MAPFGAVDRRLRCAGRAQSSGCGRFREPERAGRGTFQGVRLGAALRLEQGRDARTDRRSDGRPQRQGLRRRLRTPPSGHGDAVSRRQLVLALPPYDGEGPRTGHERLDLRRELLSERFRGRPRQRGDARELRRGRGAQILACRGAARYGRPLLLLPATRRRRLHRHYGRSRFAAWRKGRLLPLLQGLQSHVAVVQRLLVRGSDARGRGRQIHRTDARRLQEGRGRGVRRHRSGLVHRRAADRGDRPRVDPLDARPVRCLPRPLGIRSRTQSGLALGGGRSVAAGAAQLPRRADESLPGSLHQGLPRLLRAQQPGLHRPFLGARVARHGAQPRQHGHVRLAADAGHRPAVQQIRCRIAQCPLRQRAFCEGGQQCGQPDGACAS